MKYNDCFNINSPLFSRLQNGLKNLQSYNFSIQKVSLGDTFISRKKIERWKIIKDEDGQLYIGYFNTLDDYYVKPRIYVITLKTAKDHSYHILDQPRYNNLSNLKGLL